MTDYDSLHDAVNKRYQSLKESPDAIDRLKSEFGISFSVVLEIFGVSDELESGEEQI